MDIRARDIRARVNGPICVGRPLGPPNMVILLRHFHRGHPRGLILLAPPKRVEENMKKGGICLSSFILSGHCARQYYNFYTGEVNFVATDPLAEENSAFLFGELWPYVFVGEGSFLPWFVFHFL